MTERPITLTAEQVRAVLDGRKTQTRQIMKVQPESNQFGLLRITNSTKRSDIGKYHWAESNATGTHTRSALFSCPFGAVGDQMYVRENCQAFEYKSGLDAVRYSADGNEIPIKNHPLDADMWLDLYRYRGGEGRVVPSIHMPRWASRITLEITGVRVERLQAITIGDICKEGLAESMYEFKPVTQAFPSFEHYWNLLHGEESWQANPWVWVIEFKRVEAE